jgi:hypothetical protein
MSNDDKNDHDRQTSAAGPSSEDNSLVAASDYLRAGTGAMREGGASRRELFQGEVALLGAWAEEVGLLLKEDALRGLRPATSGAEHEVFFDAAK